MYLDFRVKANTLGTFTASAAQRQRVPDPENGDDGTMTWRDVTIASATAPTLAGALHGLADRIAEAQDVEVSAGGDATVEAVIAPTKTPRKPVAR